MDPLLDCLFEVEDMDISCLTESPLEIESLRGPQTDDEHSLSRELPVFSCCDREARGEDTDLLRNGFIVTGVLERLLKNECPYPGAFNVPVISLFGHMTVTCQALINDLEVNFFCFRKQLNKLIDQRINSLAADVLSLSLSHCTSFLHFLDHQTAMLIAAVGKNDDGNRPHPIITKLINSIITHLDNTVISLEPLDQFFAASIDTPPPCYHVLIHLLWCRVSVLYRAAVKYSSLSSEGGASHLTALMELCDKIIRLFLKEAAINFNKASFDQRSTIPSLFHCPCVKEVWLLVVMVTDNLANQYNTQWFWNIVSQFVSEVSADSLPFRWWVMAQVTLLYRYSVQGRITTTNELTEGNWKLVQELVSKTLKEQSSCLESLLRWSINCCLYLYSTWSNPSVSPVVLLWEHYQKQLNSSFPEARLGVRSVLSSMGNNLSSKDWFTHVDNVLCGRSNTKALSLVEDGRSSYELFLQILASVLGNDSHGNQLWQQLKSRIYSKFSQRRRVLELGQEGLCRLITLFLVLVHVTGLEEPGVQLLTFLGYRNFSNDKHRHLIWKGMMALVMTCIKKGVVLPEKIISKLASNMEDLSQQLSVDSSTTSVAVVTVLDGLSHLVNMRASLLPWTHPLYGTLFLNKVISTEATFNKTLSFVCSVLQALRSQLSEFCNPTSVAMETEFDHHAVEKLKSFSKCLWSDCCLPILKIFNSPGFNHTSSLPDTLEEMTQFACQWINFEEGNKVFTKAGLSDATPCSLSIPYLQLIVSNSTTRTVLIINEHVEFKVCHVWLRAILLMSPTHPAVSALMRSLANLLCVSQLIGGQSMENVSDPITLLLLILKAVANKYSTSERMEDKTVWRQKLYLLLGEDYCRYIDPMKSSGNTLKTYYRVSSAVVRHCSNLIYSRSSARCLLPQLLDKLVLPVMSMKRPLPKDMSQLIRTHLHHFLQGLFNLEHSNDEFVCRKIKQIFSRYFRKYVEPPSPLMGGVAPPFNPFLALLTPCFTNTPSQDNCNMMLTSLEMIVSQELTLPQRPSLMVPCVHFLNLVLSKVVCVGLFLRCVPLLTGRILFCLLLCTRSNDFGNLQKEASKCLETLMVTSSNHKDELPCSKILPVIQEYIITNLPDYKGDVFKPLKSIAVHHSALSLKVLEVSHPLIQKYEMQKGTGVDQSIRTGYQEYKNLVMKKQ